MEIFSKTGHEFNYMTWWLEKQKTRQDITLHINALDIYVRRTVFSPNPEETHSSSFLLEKLPKLTGKKFLDMGAGCGALSLASISQKAAQTTIGDIDTEAIANVQENLERYETTSTVDVYQCDLFKSLNGPFDVIAANLPIIDVAWPQIKEGTLNLHARFVQTLPGFLSPTGDCYLSFASFGDIDGFEKLIKNQTLHYKIIVERKFDINWYILKLSHDFKNSFI